jgi:hypothetical protein
MKYDVWDPKTWTYADLVDVAGRFPNAIERARNSVSMELHMSAAAQTELNRRRQLCALCKGSNLVHSPDVGREFEECPECC